MDHNQLIAETFSERLISSYMKRIEFRAYGKQILQGPLNRIIKETTQIILDRKR